MILLGIVVFIVRWLSFVLQKLVITGWGGAGNDNLGDRHRVDPLHPLSETGVAVEMAKARGDICGS